MNRTWARSGSRVNNQPDLARRGPDLAHIICQMWARPGPDLGRMMPDVVWRILPDLGHMWAGPGPFQAVEYTISQTLPDVGQIWPLSFARCGPDLARLRAVSAPYNARRRLDGFAICEPDLGQTWASSGNRTHNQPDLARRGPDLAHISCQMWARPGPDLARMMPDVG